MPNKHLNVKQSILFQGKNIWKSYGDIPILKDVNIAIRKGQILGLLGANGAGKSTLMKILVGLVHGDSGEIIIEDKSFGNHMTPHLAIESGVFLVPQEPLLFPNATIFDNITLTINENRIELRKKCEQLLKDFRSNLDLDAKAGSLKIADQQLIQIFRAIVRNAKVIILDEPTSALAQYEVETLFVHMRKLANDGMGIIFISHRLPELFAICDDIVVLKDGQVALDGPMQSYSEDDLIVAMTGKKTNIYKRKSKQQSATHQNENTFNTAPIALSINDLSGDDFHRINLDIKQGEIVGITGIVGSGRTELAEALVGVRPFYSGHFTLNGIEFNANTKYDVNIMQEHGLAYLPEDRQHYGLFLDSSVLLNLLSGSFEKLPFKIDHKDELDKLDKFQQLFNIVYSSPEQHIRRLSGGNQQKILLAKWLLFQPKILILDEPTRGVDVKTRNEIYHIIDQLNTEHHLTILLISSDYEEIIATCDKCYIMRFGEVSAQLKQSELKLDTINALSWGQKSEVSSS